MDCALTGLACPAFGLANKVSRNWRLSKSKFFHQSFKLDECRADEEQQSRGRVIASWRGRQLVLPAWSLWGLLSGQCFRVLLAPEQRLDHLKCNLTEFDGEGHSVTCCMEEIRQAEWGESCFRAISVGTRDAKGRSEALLLSLEVRKRPLAL